MSRNAPFEARFWEKVDFGPLPGYAPGLGNCWVWTAGLQGRKGCQYGQTYDDVGRGCRANRVAYEFLVGPIPDGLVLDHLCRNTICVRPDHLEAVTVRENNRRGSCCSGGLYEPITHCARGHEYTLENTYRPPRNPANRQCRACQALRMRTARRAKRQVTSA